MTPEQLKQLNIDHFKLLLERTTDHEERRRIERLLDEEVRKPDSAYPALRPNQPW
jgi:hypothetical protein